MAAFEHPRVGVACFIVQRQSGKDPLYIMGQRYGSTGSGTWALPGGHLEKGESFEQCSEREIMEETGLRVKNVRYLTATNDIMHKDNKHYITIFLVCERDDDTAEPQLLEPNKCLQWKWVRWSEMVRWAAEEQHDDSTYKLFSPMIALLEQRPDAIPAVSES